VAISCARFVKKSKKKTPTNIFRFLNDVIIGPPRELKGKTIGLIHIIYTRALRYYIIQGTRDRYSMHVHPGSDFDTFLMTIEGKN
jgi:hypothetical protein